MLEPPLHPVMLSFDSPVCQYIFYRYTYAVHLDVPNQVYHVARCSNYVRFITIPIGLVGVVVDWRWTEW